MLRRSFLFTALAALTVSACDLSPTGTDSAALGDDYALAMFGEPGTALEGLMGPQVGPRPFDGRSGRPTLPDSLAITDEQRAAADALREAFSAENEAALAELRAIFEEARAARQSGATRAEVREILLEGRPIAFSLRPAVHELHVALRALLTDAQRAWIDAHRPRRFPPPLAP